MLTFTRFGDVLMTLHYSYIPLKGTHVMAHVNVHVNFTHIYGGQDFVKNNWALHQQNVRVRYLFIDTHPQECALFIEPSTSMCSKERGRGGKRERDRTLMEFFTPISVLSTSLSPFILC